jgi:predicted porin
MIRTLIAAAAALGIAASAAGAVTVANMDKTTAHFTYQPAKGKVEHLSLRASHHKVLSCKNGGTLTIGTSSTTCTAKTGTITIKGGKFAS